MTESLRTLTAQELLALPKKRRLYVHRNDDVNGSWVDIEMPTGSVYEIPLASLRTEGDALRWIVHLAEKKWIDTDMLGRVAALVIDYLKEVQQ